MRPDTNPLLEKINANPQLRGMENEIFVYEMNSLHGDTFLFHFDVNKMRNFTLTYRLTKREREVFLYLVKGYRNKEIADTLHLSEYTIKNHIDSILNKLDAKSRLEVIVKFA
ncbi:hypothetical protein CI793_14450 [Anoxybacillus ayderensis]|nr:hypothetical protein CI793_14450 [Anoxybacillus ayderensis]